MKEPDHDSEAMLRLRAEILDVRTESVPDRNVTVARDVIATDVRFDVTLLVEDVRIAEGPVTRIYADVPPIDEPQRVVVRLSRERAHVGLRVVEYERVAVGTRETIGNARVSTTLRHEELTLEQRGSDRP